MRKKKGIGKIFIILFCLVLVILFALVESGMTPKFLVSYQNNFKRNISGICQKLHIELPIDIQLYLDNMSEPKPAQIMTPASEERESLSYPGYKEEPEEEKESSVTLTAKEKKEQKKDLPTAFSSAENSVFESYGNDIICANETVYAKFNADGRQVWSKDIQMQEPMLTVAGDYVLINETGGKKLNLYKGKKLLFSAETEGNIITGDLSEKGDVVLVTEKEYYKGQVVIFNKNGTKIYAWDSGSYTILDAAVSKNRKLAVSLLTTDSGVDTIISVYDVRTGKKISETEPFIDTVIFDIGFYKNNITALADNKFLNLSQKGKIKREFYFENRNLEQYKTSENGNTALLFDNEGTGEIVILKPNGRQCGTLKTLGMPDTFNIKRKYVAYNNGRQAVLSGYSGKSVFVADCDADIKQLCITGTKKLFCVYSSSVQEKKVSKKKKTKEVFETKQEEPTK